MARTGRRIRACPARGVPIEIGARMDPDANYAELTALIDNIAGRLDAAPSEDGVTTIDDDAVHRLIDLWQGLDHWLRKEGVLPKAWHSRVVSTGPTPVVSMAAFLDPHASVEAIEAAMAAGERLVAVCAHPGDYEHDHEMCRDAAAERVVNPAPVVVPKEWIRRAHDLPERCGACGGAAGRHYVNCSR